MLLDLPHLETERLILRVPNGEDLDGWSALLADEESARFIGGSETRRGAWRSMAIMAGSWLVNGFGMFSVIEKKSGKWIGRLVLGSPSIGLEPKLAGLSSRMPGARVTRSRVRKLPLIGHSLHSTGARSSTSSRRKIIAQKHSPSASELPTGAPQSCLRPTRTYRSIFGSNPESTGARPSGAKCPPSGSRLTGPKRLDG